MLLTWQDTWYTSERMAVAKLINLGVRLAVVFGIGSAALTAQAPVATFSSGIDLVSVSAVVRDHKGRFVQNLTARDFEVLDAGQVRPISDFRRDLAGVRVAPGFRSRMICTIRSSFAIRAIRAGRPPRNIRPASFGPRIVGGWSRISHM